MASYDRRDELRLEELEPRRADQNQGALSRRRASAPRPFPDPHPLVSMGCGRSRYAAPRTPPQPWGLWDANGELVAPGPGGGGGQGKGKGKGWPERPVQVVAGYGPVFLPRGLHGRVEPYANHRHWREGQYGCPTFPNTRGTVAASCAT